MPLKPVVTFLAVTFAWSWGFWALPVLAHRGVEMPWELSRWALAGGPAAWGPFAGAVVVALMRGGPAHLWAFLWRATRLDFGFVWYLVVFLTFPVLIYLAVLFASASGAMLEATTAMQHPGTIPLAFFVILLTGGPLQEEYGWRGTLLDPLQARFGALGASLVVGAIWALWHLPLFLWPNDAGPYYGRPFWGTLLTLVLISVLFTWVWNNTGRSLAAVLIFHTMFNLSHWVFPALEDDTAGLTLFGFEFALVVLVVLLFGPRRLIRRA
ncbi:MAG: CPBP family intramembrane metalloprotease [Maritimibacter sp.]|nr:CPBP family intramembrane metalloprotease [Maritimibacter sp.]